MRIYERDDATKKADVRRAMEYSYRKSRMLRQRMDAFVQRMLAVAITLFVTATVIAVLV